MSAPKMLPALLGGLFIGVLSSLPYIKGGNICCCLWVVSGGALAAWLMQQNTAAPDHRGRRRRRGAALRPRRDLRLDRLASRDAPVLEHAVRHGRLPAGHERGRPRRPARGARGAGEPEPGGDAGRRRRHLGGRLDGSDHRRPARRADVPKKDGPTAGCRPRRRGRSPRRRSRRRPRSRRRRRSCRHRRHRRPRRRSTWRRRLDLGAAGRSRRPAPPGGWRAADGRPVRRRRADDHDPGRAARSCRRRRSRPPARRAAGAAIWSGARPPDREPDSH